MLRGELPFETQPQVARAKPVATNDAYSIEWIVPECPPLPPVKMGHQWVSWEKAYGLPPIPQKVQVKRLKNPRPVPPFNPQKQWLERKRQIAPWLNDEQLRFTPASTPASGIAQRRANQPNFFPKIDSTLLRASAQKNTSVIGFSKLSLTGAGQNSPQASGGEMPLLNLVGVNFNPQGYTEYELWITNAASDEWFEIYFADELNPHQWVLAHIGPPQVGFGTSLQRYFVHAYGHPTQGFFQAFLFQDSDGDGLSDGMEATVFKSDPSNPDSEFHRDANGDGQHDFPNRAGNWRADGDEDFDGDELSNLKELQMGTDPLVAQNNLTDSDNDGLPDWVENLIWVYQGVANPDLRDDSDGDGVDNYAEIAALTDSSWPDEAYNYANFYNLGDEQRAFNLAPITLQHTPDTNAASTNHLIFDNAGTLGTYLHLEVRRNQDAYGAALPGYDTIHIGGAFLSPSGGIFLDSLIDGLQPSDAFKSQLSILASLTNLGADVWEEAKVSDAIDDLNVQTLAVIQQRSMLRTILRMRELQMAVNLTDFSTGAQMRLCTAISEVHTETVLFKETSAKIAQYQGQNWWTRAGHWVSNFGRAATVYSFYDSVNGILVAADPYIRDVRRRCDNNGDTAADLAVALGNMANDFANGFMLGNFWLIYWNQLSEFDGYDSSCF